MRFFNKTIAAALLASAFLLTGCKEDKTPGYTLTDGQKQFFEFYVKLQQQIFLTKNPGGIISENRSIVFTNSVDATALYEKNQVAGDQKFYNKLVYISGIISRVGSGLGNEPYVVLKSKSFLSDPQLRFVPNYNEKIADFEKGSQLDAVCFGNGSIAGTPMFRECMYASDYSTWEAGVLRKAISDFFSGNPVEDYKRLFNQRILQLILAAEYMPKNSICFNDETFWSDECIKTDFNKAVLSVTEQQQRDLAKKLAEENGLTVVFE